MNEVNEELKNYKHKLILMRQCDLETEALFLFEEEDDLDVAIGFASESRNIEKNFYIDWIKKQLEDNGINYIYTDLYKPAIKLL